MSEEIKLNDLRRFAILSRTAITYRSHQDGRACVVNRNGAIEIPAISGRPTFNAEGLLAVADEFHLEPDTDAPRSVAREELAGLIRKVVPAVTPSKED